MRAPKKVIAAMAMATLLGGAAAPAFADVTTNYENGQPVSKQVKAFEEKDASSMPSEESEIQINGTFTTRVNPFPAADREGRYLRVTMPLKLDYQYDVNSKVLIPGESEIVNHSSYATPITGQNGKFDEKPQQITMTFMGLEDTTKNGTIQYVNLVNPSEAEAQNKVQVPFGLVISQAGKESQTISFADMQNVAPGSKPISINIGADCSIGVKIGKVKGQDVANAKELGDKTQTISHNMKLRFEYSGI